MVSSLTRYMRSIQAEPFRRPSTKLGGLVLLPPL